ncbi:single-stranded DNA-binding protein [Lacticaseibacillus chiayiensis]|uniref:Single-stranded DNA-binding protein n=1 Tax=Lacticaseibacillus chiayiensis TaxID=2100821 RepID=A0ABY6H6Q0_9LACO|nr:single-stranded DNA-binding protein [Lacticaseibacillus chiayiensis]QVI34786.1 single-stranded DNA-binding protein [Lacticaseibacillus chiayiensis]RXT57775.1 single-stranded DNA-binding protein [Lacticaseibacillus chiayiensis]UYN56540.1 single-stranded DNA-binding protein [Lacticaseibacillus chiayiensis]
MLNSVALTGRLTRDVDLRYTQSGTAVGSFTLAVDRQFRSANGERETDFINCVIWRKSAENFANFTKKGSLVGIEGHIQTRSYDNAQGQKVYVTEVVVENFALLESRATTQQRPSEPANPAGQGNQNYGGGQQFGNNQQPQTPPSFGSQSAPNNAPSSNPGQNPAAGQSQGNNGNTANPDPFANNGKPIDISDDDLPF